MSVPPEAYLVHAIAGERVRARVLLRPGATPHTYEPSMADARVAAGAVLYLAVGHPQLGFETAWRGVLGREGGPRIVALDEECETRRDDPHVWLSVPCFRIMARRTASALAGILPPEAGPALARGLDSLLARVDASAARADSLLAPFRNRSFLVYHPAWGYFAREHGLEQVSVQVGSREPGPAELAHVFEAVRKGGLHVMFIQPGTPPAEARRIAAQLGVETAVLDPLAEDWPEMYVDAARTLRRSWER